MKNEKNRDLFIIMLKYLSTLILPVTVCIASLLSAFIYFNDKFNNIFWFFALIICIFVLIFVLFWMCKKKLVNYMTDLKKNYINKCIKCINKHEKYIFDEYGLITLNDVVEKEKKLGSRCKIYNFTTLDNTVCNEGARDMIINNLNRGVEYKIFYANPQFNNSDNIRLYGSENIIYTETNELFNLAWFDILLHITTSETGYTENVYGYAAVNFTPTNGNCGFCQNSNICNYENNFIFYKVLDSSLARCLYNLMNEKINRNKVGK